MPLADNDARVTAYLQRLADKDEAPETPGEIASGLGLTTAQVRASLNRLTKAGTARQVGEAMSGGKTWVLTGDPRVQDN